MRPLFFWALLLCLYLPSRAQYVIVPVQTPPSFTFSDLWHFSVIRSAADDFSEFYITIRIYDGNNLLKVKSNTATLALPTGTHYYNLSNISGLEPFVTSYYDASLLQQAVSSGGFFPPGTYNITYTLYGKAADGEFSPIIENISEAVVEAMWPPMLLSPPDADTIDTQYPLLMWTPAFSSALSGQITYTLNLVELLPSQNPYQAIVSNPIYYSQNNIPITVQQYPANAQSLDTGTVYAWQVHADAQGTSLGSSEVWTFTMGHPIPTQMDSSQSQKFYFTMDDHYPEKIMEIREKIIRFKYIDAYNQSTDSLKSFSLYRDGYENPMLTGASYDSILHINRAYYSLVLENNNDFVPGHYLLMVTNIKNRTFYLRIIYRDEE